MDTRFLIKGVFWIVAGVVAAHLAIAMGCMAFCMYYGQEIVEGKYKCDPNGRCVGILSAPFEFIGEAVKGIRKQ
jgi:hypothetical protein